MIRVVFLRSSVVLVLSAALAIACSSSSSGGGSDAPALAPSCTRTDLDSPPPVTAHTPRWTFEPWISKDISTRQDTYDFVDGFRTRGIPIGAVVLDSPWETNYNDFEPNPSRYPDMGGLIADMHARNVKVVFWITSLVNQFSYDFEPGGDHYASASPNLQEGADCNYFVDQGMEYQWWKGQGAGLDFFNPSAVAWWHRAQDQVLTLGLDGWKTDFGENYIGPLTDPSHTFQTMAGDKTRQEYSEQYYRDFIEYGRMKNGPEFVVMARAWDESYGFTGRFYARPEHASVAWMGDNRRDYLGLADALNESFISAKAGYVMVGSDIGGYLDTDDKDLTGPKIPFDTTVFARWVAVGALSPFMQLHGRANITPWTVPDHVDETVALYKYWATLHHALSPYFYSLAEEGWAGRAAPIVRPIGDPSSWAGDFRYMLGDAFFVAPIVDATGKRDVAMPPGSYCDWFTGEQVQGAKTTRDYSADTSKIPLFVKDGAIVPMTIDSDVLGFGAASDATARTVLVWPSSQMTTFPLHEDDDSITTISAQLAGDQVTVILTSAPKPLVLRIAIDRAPKGVALNGVPITSAVYDAAKKVLVVRAPASAMPTRVDLVLGPFVQKP